MAIIFHKKERTEQWVGEKERRKKERKEETEKQTWREQENKKEKEPKKRESKWLDKTQQWVAFSEGNYNIATKLIFQ